MHIKIRSKIFIIFIWCLTVFFVGHHLQKRKTTEIIRIASPDCWEVNGEQILYNYYMIINPPDEIDELREILISFCREVDVEYMKEDLSERKEYSKIELNFFRESFRLKRNWKQNEGYFSDYITDYKQDLIAGATWKIPTREDMTVWCVKKKKNGDIIY